MSDGTTPSSLTGPTRAPTSTRRAVLNTIKGSAGNLVEWYDVYVYTVFATYFEAQFFDKNDTNSTVYIYAIFAVTFVMRPVGSWFFGRYADRRGRKAALMLSITVMSTCSFLVAVMPTREIIGYWAAVILVLARLVQGFATGGEYGTSATYMSEAATANRRGFLSSFQYVTLIGGHVLAQFTLLIALHFLDGDALRAWGWRIGFFIGGIAALVVLWIRRSMDESLSESHLEAIREGKDRDAGSMKTLFTTHWRPLLLVFLITAGGTIAFYTYSINAPAIVKSTFGSDRALTATWINLLGLIFLMLLQPVGGLISDRVGRKPLLVFFGVGGVIYTYVLLTFLPQGTVNLSNPRAIFAGSPPRFTRSRVTYEAYVVSRTSTRPQVDRALLIPCFDHHSAADHHRDVAVPHREVAGQQRVRRDGGHRRLDHEPARGLSSRATACVVSTQSAATAAEHGEGNQHGGQVRNPPSDGLGKVASAPLRGVSWRRLPR